jgi:hypothetical protein
LNTFYSYRLSCAFGNQMEDWTIILISFGSNLTKIRVPA